MTKDFSFYEFTGIIVPSVTLLFFTGQLIDLVYGKHLIDFSKVGESIVFFVIAYGVGHILHSVGNLYENIFWKVFGGMPTHWLTNQARFGLKLFSKDQNDRIALAVYSKFTQEAGKDYGRDVYNWLSLKDKLTEKRIDVFTANYSMFRGLTVSFYLLTGVVAALMGWKFSLISLALGLLANIRMFHFAKLYAQEVFRSYWNYVNP